MSLIYKYTLNPLEPTVMMPQGAQLLHVHEQNGQLRIWAAVDPYNDDVKRRIIVVPTGLSSVPDNAPYIGSVHLEDRESTGMMLVFHLFDGGET